MPDMGRGSVAPPTRHGSNAVMAPALPIHPFTGLTAVAVLPSGRIVWPIFGAEDDPDNPVQPPADTPTDTGFPANTPIAEMTVDQQAAYWKHQARRHEDRVKAFGGLTPEQITDLQERAEQFDILAAASQTDTERAISEAAFNARAVAEAEIMPRLVTAEFRVAAAGRLEADKLATILEPLDLSKFLTDNGDVDTAKVSAFVDGIAPAKGTERRQGPSSGGAGRRGSYTAAGSSVAAGRDLFADRHKTRSSTASDA